MPRYAAVLRGVMPTNARMPQLKRAFERAAFADVKTVLGSGNVYLPRAPRSSRRSNARAKARCSSILAGRFHVRPGDVFSAYTPTPKGAVFMSLIEQTFGKDVTARTWDTIAKIAR